jgi:hypothetical protein
LYFVDKESCVPGVFVRFRNGIPGIFVDGNLRAI